MNVITGTALDAQSVEIPLDDAESFPKVRPRSYQKLMESARVLQPGQIDEMEAI